MSIPPPPRRRAHPVAVGLVAWLAMVGTDLALHAGLLAPLYDWEGGFLAAPQEAFVRIPAGYLALAVLAGALVWLLPRLGAVGSARGARAGAALGAVVAGALLVGIWSITSAPPGLLAAWWIGQTVQLATGGAFVGAAARGVPVGRLTRRALAILAVGAVVAVVLQSVGYAPAPVIGVT